MNQQLKKMFTTNRILYVTTVGMFVLSILFLVGLQLDHRTILNINPWIKPLKFSMSILIYTLTMIYLLQFHSQLEQTQLSRKIAATMWIEMILVTVQALRGVTSHFNDSSIGNSIVFAVMGIAILYNSWVMAKITFHFFKNPPQEFSQNQLQAIRLGLVLFLLGCLEGAYMSSGKGHTVGAADGGPGLLFLNWSTVAGDLRISHFLGLHGIQVLLVLYFLSSFFFHRISTARKIQITSGILHMAFVFVLFLTVFSFGQAIAGKSSYFVRSQPSQLSE